MAEDLMSEVYASVAKGDVENARTKLREYSENEMKGGFEHERDAEIIGNYVRRASNGIDLVQDGILASGDLKDYTEGGKEIHDKFRQKIYNSVKNKDYESARKFMKLSYSVAMSTKSYDITKELDLIEEGLKKIELGEIPSEDIDSYATNTREKTIKTDKYERDKSMVDKDMGSLIDIAKGYNSSIADKLKKIQAELEEEMNKTVE